MAKLLTDSAGRVVAFGADSIAPQAGQTLQECGLTLGDFAAVDSAGKALGTPYDVTYDGKAFAVRARAANPVEQATTARAALLAQVQAAVTAWPTATAAQKDAAILALLQLAARLAQG